jgi:hypothetical protein
MYYLIIFIIFIFNFISIPSYIEAATLHAILIGDTFNQEDSTGFEGGIDLWKRETQRIAALTNLELNGVIFEAHHCRIELIMNYLDDLEVGSQDVILIYFALHGSRTYAKETKWPYLTFSLDHQKIDFSVFNDKLKHKSPRLLLSIADSCNNLISSEQISHESEQLLPLYLDGEEVPRQSFSNSLAFETLLLKNTSIDIRQKYRSLFLSFQGSVFISTSSPGQFSIKHKLTGGIFTSQFIECLRQPATSLHPIHWELILNEASYKTMRKVEELKGELHLEQPQIPQFELHLKKFFP